MLFGARALQGGFAALMAPAALSLLTVTFTEAHERARAFGVYGAIAGSGAAIGLVLGGVLTQYASWRWTLLINMPIALIAALMASRVIRESRVEVRHSYDLPGAVTSTGGLFLSGLRLHDGGVTRLGIDAHGVAPCRGGRAAWRIRGDRDARRPSASSHQVVLERNRGGSFLASLLVGCPARARSSFLTYFLQGISVTAPCAPALRSCPSRAASSSARGSPAVSARAPARALMVAGLARHSRAALVHAPRRRQRVPHARVGPELLVSIGMGLAFVPMNSTRSSVSTRTAPASPVRS